MLVSRYNYLQMPEKQENPNHKGPSPPCFTLDRQDNLDTHVFPLVHQLAVNDLLVSADTIALRIRGIRGRCNLDLSPLAVGGHNHAVGHELLEALVDTLLFDTAFALDKGGSYVQKTGVVSTWA